MIQQYLSRVVVCAGVFLIFAWVHIATLAQPQVSNNSRLDSVIENDPVRFYYNVDIPMRDGVNLKANIFRPNTEGRYPIIVTHGALIKDYNGVELLPGEPTQKSRYYSPRMIDPDWWVPRGYILVRVDGRGFGQSPGKNNITSSAEAEDYYDAIQWLASQSWSNGRIGTQGLGYNGTTQWLVAALQPPALKAMIPWNPPADLYRDLAYHGGIFYEGFISLYFDYLFAAHLSDQNENPDERFLVQLKHLARQPINDEFYVGRAADWSKVKVPFLAVSHWSDSKDTRGATEAWLQAASEYKYLQLHARQWVDRFYDTEQQLAQLAFYDHWLKDDGNGDFTRPKVSLCVRTNAYECEFRDEESWPPERTEYRRYYLDSNETGGSSLVEEPPSRATSFQYSGRTADVEKLLEPGHLIFLSPPFEVDTELTGYFSLRLWAESTSEDMDVFTIVSVVRADGTKDFISRGWLRASHRALNVLHSKPWRPYHLHDKVEPMISGEVVSLDIEILPNAMVLKAGDSLELYIGSDEPLSVKPHFRHRSRNHSGETFTLYTDKGKASYLLVPVIR